MKSVADPCDLLRLTVDISVGDVYRFDFTFENLTDSDIFVFTWMPEIEVVSIEPPSRLIEELLPLPHGKPRPPQESDRLCIPAKSKAKYGDVAFARERFPYFQRRAPNTDGRPSSEATYYRLRSPGEFTVKLAWRFYERNGFENLWTGRLETPPTPFTLKRPLEKADE